MFKKAKNQEMTSASGAGKLHVRVEYSLDAQFVSELIDTGFDTFNRFQALMAGKPDPGLTGVTDGKTPNA